MIQFLQMLDAKLAKQLNETALAMVAKGKGILAADESTSTITKRLDSIGVESTEETRRFYRQILLTTKEVEKYISGVILYDETIRQKADDGTPFPKALSDQGILPGIKVDTGAKPLALSPQETVTEGLDGLRERLQEYYKLGARFAKWRAVITIAWMDLPTDYCIHVNAHALGRYAALCQENGLVPIVEPEVMMDGGNMNHSIERCEEVTTKVLRAVFEELAKQQVDLKGIILKPNMIVPGKKIAMPDPKQVAEHTLRVYKQEVPIEVPGCVFLSGGQSDTDATVNMNEMNKMGPHPWELSFSYGRGLQAAVLEAWKGKKENVAAAQKALLKRAMLNGAARDGKYTPEMEK